MNLSKVGILQYNKSFPICEEVYGSYTDTIAYITTVVEFRPGFFVPLHQEITCKDYITDIMYSETLGKDIEIYKFEWSPLAIIEEDYYYLNMRYDSIHSKDFIRNGVRFFNRLPKHERWKPITTIDVRSEDSVIVAIPMEYMRKPVLASLVLLLLRMGISFGADYNSALDYFEKIRTIETISSSDRYMFRKPERDIALRILALENLSLLPDYNNYKDIGLVHNSSGFFSTCIKLVLPQLEKTV